MGFLEFCYGRHYEKRINELVNFERERQMKVCGKVDHFAWRMRMLTLFINVCVLAFVFMFWPLNEAIANIFSKFTNWTLLMTLAHQLLVIQAASDKRINKRPGLLAAVHMTFEATLIMNIITVSVYWTILHSVEIAKQQNPYRRIQLYQVHIFPALAMAVNYVWLDVRVEFSHVKSLVAMALVYGACNFY